MLKPGGTFACLKFNKPLSTCAIHVSLLSSCSLLIGVSNQYSFLVIPLLSKILAGNCVLYQYLVESIQHFPSQSDFAQLIADTGFAVGGDFEGDSSAWWDLWGGIACIHRGVKL